jgi:hypothetical protein
MVLVVLHVLLKFIKIKIRRIEFLKLDFIEIIHNENELFQLFSIIQAIITHINIMLELYIYIYIYMNDYVSIC